MQVGETEKNAMAGRQAGMHVAFPVITETARSYILTGAAIPPGTVAITPRETAQVGFDGALYLQHPEPGQVVEVTGGCKAQTATGPWVCANGGVAGLPVIRQPLENKGLSRLRPCETGPASFG